MERVTVLIAVYNAERYLRQCLDSLLAQTMGDWKAMCVDDDSTDGSLAILNEYAGKDSRFEVVHLDKNRGQAHARNVGLSRAGGDIICFLDSDDWLSADALQSAVGVFDSHKQTGCVLFHCVIYTDGKEKKYPMDDFEVMDGKEAFVKSLTWSIHGIYAVKSDIHKKYPYDETLHAYGDDNVTRLHYLASEEVRMCDGVYYYRNHGSSVSHNISVHRFDFLKANSIMRHHLETLGVSRDIMATYENCRWTNIIDMCLFYYLHHRELPSVDARYGLLVIRRAWESIDIRMLDHRSHHHRFGYMPLRFSWTAFRIQEKIFFFLRGIIGRNKEWC